MARRKRLNLVVRHATRTDSRVHEIGSCRFRDAQVSAPRAQHLLDVRQLDNVSIDVAAVADDDARVPVEFNRRGIAKMLQHDWRTRWWIAYMQRRGLTAYMSHVDIICIDGDVVSVAQLNVVLTFEARAVAFDKFCAAVTGRDEIDELLNLLSLGAICIAHERHHVLGVLVVSQLMFCVTPCPIGRRAAVLDASLLRHVGLPLVDDELQLPGDGGGILAVCSKNGKKHLQSV